MQIRKALLNRRCPVRFSDTASGTAAGSGNRSYSRSHWKCIQRKGCSYDLGLLENGLTPDVAGATPRHQDRGEQFSAFRTSFSKSHLNFLSILRLSHQDGLG